MLAWGAYQALVFCEENCDPSINFAYSELNEHCDDHRVVKVSQTPHCLMFYTGIIKEYKRLLELLQSWLGISGEV